MKSDSFISSLKKALHQGLPGELAHQSMMPLKRPLSSDAKREATNYRESAVGIILHPANDSIECVLIRRPSYNGAHSGQISFPGGKRDLADHDLEYTARRESMEEIALPFDRAELIHPLTEVFIPVSQFSVQPYLFYVEKLPELIPDVREVEEIISFDVFELVRTKKTPRTSIPINAGLIMKDIPYFDIHGHIVWGATAMMLAELRVLLERIDSLDGKFYIR